MSRVHYAVLAMADTVRDVLHIEYADSLELAPGIRLRVV